MPERKLAIALEGGGAISALRTSPAGARWLFVYAPGAGANLYDPFGRYAAKRLGELKIAMLRFHFPYMEARKRRPDRTAVLEATWRAVLASVRRSKTPIAAGGRSMGGRIASHVVAQGERVDALALFAYPLHSPAKPAVWRDEHLGEIEAPTLFCSGTRDAFAKPDELRRAIAKMPHAQLHVLEDADHGFAVPKSSGRTREDIWEHATLELASFLTDL